jgi:hypothetical protein
MPRRQNQTAVGETNHSWGNVRNFYTPLKQNENNQRTLESDQPMQPAGQIFRTAGSLNHALASDGAITEDHLYATLNQGGGLQRPSGQARSMPFRAKPGEFDRFLRCELLVGPAGPGHLLCVPPLPWDSSTGVHEGVRGSHHELL